MIKNFLTKMINIIFNISTVSNPACCLETTVVIIFQQTLKQCL